MTVQHKTIMGAVLFALGISMIIVYMTSDKAHLHDQVFLWSGVGLTAWGAHMVSRQSVRDFLSDAGRFLPWGKSRTQEHRPPDGPGV